MKKCYCLFLNEFVLLIFTNKYEQYSESISSWKWILWQCRWWYILEAVMNLCLNILLGYIWKINGILIATIITLFAFNFMPRTAVIFRDYFKRDKKEFLLNHFVYFIVTVAIAVITAMFISLIPTGGLIKFVIKSIAVAFISAILFIIAYRKNQYFAGLTSILKHKFKL